MAKKIRQTLDGVEGVVVKFLGHVRHDGQDYHAGDTAELAPEHAAKLVDLHAAEAVAAVEPAADAGAEAATPDPAAPAGK